MKLLTTISFLLLFSITAYSQTLKTGSSVEIKWDTNWYPATIAEVSGSQYRVHLDSDGDNHDRDQWITKGSSILRTNNANPTIISPKKTTPATVIVQKQPTQNKVSAKRIEVIDSGHWYKATIIDQKGDTYKVHFDGYPASDDKWVHRSYTRNLAENGDALQVACNFNPPPGTFTDSSPASDALFKREIYDWYNRFVNGTLSRPTRIGVVFTMFSRQASYKNTVANVPGVGATRRHSGAPANTTIYPVKMTFFVCEDYNGNVEQKQVNSDFSFFVNKDGQWTCSKDN